MLQARYKPIFGYHVCSQVWGGRLDRLISWFSSLVAKGLHGLCVVDTWDYKANLNGSFED